MSLKFKMAAHQDLPPRNLPPLPGPSTITEGPDLLATTSKKKKRLSAGITGSDSQLSSSALASRGGVDGVEDGASANGSVDNVWEPQQDRQERKARQRKKRQSRNVEEEGAGTDLSEKSKRQSKALDDEEGKDKVAVSPRQRRRHHRGRRGENGRNPAASPKTKRNISRQGVTTFLTQTSESSGVTPSPRTARKAQIKSVTKSPRVRRSVSEEGIDEIPDSGKKRRKPKSRPEGEGEGSAEGEGEGGEKARPPRPQPGKKKKKKNARTNLTSADEAYQADGEVSVDFMVADEDIIVGDKTTDMQKPHKVSSMTSQPVGPLFVETKSGFRVEQRRRLSRLQETDEEYAEQDKADRTTGELALSTHRGFKKFALFCHGILAGYSLWHCIVVFLLTEKGDLNFLQQYSRLAQPAQSLFYILLAICTVSVFDSYDVARPNRRFFRSLLTPQSGAISILVYLISIIFSVSIASIDDRIGLFVEATPTVLPSDVSTVTVATTNQDLWTDSDAANRLYIWRIINTMRVGGAILGWLIVALNPTVDHTSEHLYDPEDSLVATEMVPRNPVA
ncbi:transmembrane protein 237-like [Branchiostoma lanceolatum]|uniref:transmembrane protein 237-like n=1 Tax=Branchiostoma lanceolatum TaxID=7740 RepID=UPI003455AA50